jgi:hypothetical protein
MACGISSPLLASADSDTNGVISEVMKSTFFAFIGLSFWSFIMQSYEKSVKVASVWLRFNVFLDL